MNNKMKIKIQKRKKKREGEEGRGREMEHDAEWVYEATMGAETIRVEPLQHGEKKKNTDLYLLHALLLDAFQKYSHSPPSFFPSTGYC
jgi:hypothetical protein